MMSRAKVSLRKSEVLRLYRKRRLSQQKIADLVGCSQGTITNRMREWRVTTRSKAHMRIRYAKRQFSGNQREKAYLLGFRLGDLNVYKPTKKSEIFVVRCHTAVFEQVRLIKSLFQEYGGVKVSNSPTNGFTINCFVDDSFAFLYTKRFPMWVSRQEDAMTAFFAGYTDAEGTFGLNQGKERFKIDSYDYDILKRCYAFFLRKSIEAKFYPVGRSGALRSDGTRWNGDMWRLQVSRASSLKMLVNMILPFLRHKKRKKDAIAVLENIYARKKNGTIQ